MSNWARSSGFPEINWINGLRNKLTTLTGCHDREGAMKLEEARQILKGVQGRSLWWLKEWGLSTIKEAIYTIRNRRSATDADMDLVEDVNRKIYGY